MTGEQMGRFRALGAVAVLCVAGAACTAPPASSRADDAAGLRQSASRVEEPPSRDYPVAPAPLAGSEVVFSGYGSGERDSWQTFSLTVPSESDVSTSLDWNSIGPSNLNVYLKTADGSADHDYANGTTAKPEVAGARLAPGTYMVAVKIKTGTPQTGFTISVDMTPVGKTPATTAPVPTTPAPTTPPPTAPPTTAKPPAPPAAGAFPGDVPAGYVRWGAAVGGNSDPVVRHEDPAGTQMGLRRTYFAWHHIASGYLLRTVRDDLSVGRLPWVSLKTPGWTQLASGSYDAEIDAMLRSLDSVGGPVWLTIHHEPENDGLRASDWRAMQRKIRERMDAVGVSNIAFAPVLMSWTYDPRSGRNPSDWWVDGIWDFVGIDHYVEKENLTMGSPDDVLWQHTDSWLRSKGLPVALGEWANRGTDAAAAADMQGFYDLATASATSAGVRVIGMAYFDSGLNSPLGSYELQGQPLAKFRELMRAPTSLRLAT